MSKFYNCPNCKEENEAYTEGFGSDLIVDFSECHECGYNLTKEEELNIYSKISEDDMGEAIDYANDYLKDK